MRVFLFCVGSRGDIEPCISLSTSLSVSSHSVHLFVQTDYVPLVPSNPLIHVHPLPFTQLDFYKYTANPVHGQSHPNPRVRFLGMVATMIPKLVLPCLPSVFEVADNDKPDLLIGTSLARQITLAAADKYEIPLIWTNFQPLLPTVYFKHYSYHEEALDAMFSLSETPSVALPDPETQKCNRDSYLDLERHLYDFLATDLQNTYDSLNLGCIPTFDDVITSALLGARKKHFHINAYSPLVMPACPDHNSTTCTLGAMADAYIPNGWVADEDLENFIDSCETKPLCVGFGSMPVGRKETVLNFLLDMGRPVVAVGAGLSEKKLEWLFEVKSVPYAWLLPKCEMIICHGGMGVLHAGLRAGIPVVIAPLFGDQMMTADWVERKGWGVRCSENLGMLEKDEVIKGVKKAEACKEECKKIGMEMRADGNGAVKVVKWIEGIL